MYDVRNSVYLQKDTRNRKPEEQIVVVVHYYIVIRNSSRTLCSISNGTGYLLPTVFLRFFGSEGTYLMYIMYYRYWIGTFYCIFWNLESGTWII
jgi:hypothetical protein